MVFSRNEAILENILTEFKHHCEFIGIETNDSDIQHSGIRTITTNGCIFDIENHTCDTPKSVLAKELRRFLSRYGIRFKTSS